MFSQLRKHEAISVIRLSAPLSPCSQILNDLPGLKPAARPAAGKPFLIAISEFLSFSSFRPTLA
jgi:hypothetical protein